MITCQIFGVNIFDFIFFIKKEQVNMTSLSHSLCLSVSLSKLLSVDWDTKISVLFFLVFEKSLEFYKALPIQTRE